MKEKNKIIILIVLIISILGYLIYHGNDKIDGQIVEIVEVESKEQEAIEDKNNENELIKHSMTSLESHDDLQNLLLHNKKAYVLFCHMDDCYWCEKMAPVVEQGAANPELQNIEFYSINSKLVNDSDLLQKIVGKEIAGYPYTVCMNQGACIHELEGYCEPEEFENEIKSNFNKV